MPWRPGRKPAGQDRKAAQFAVDITTGRTAFSYPRATKKNSWVSGGGSLRIVHDDGERGKGMHRSFTVYLTDVESGEHRECKLHDDRIFSDEAFQEKYRYRGNVVFPSTNASSFQANRMFVRRFSGLSAAPMRHRADTN